MPDNPRRAQPFPPRGTAATLFPIVMVAAAWWLLTRPYHGIFHDGVFYTAQALKRLYPAQYAGDVFFLYGSQDDFTFYGQAQARLADWLGVDQAFLLLTLAGAALWSFALLYLLRRWLSALPLAASLVLVLSADPHYGGFDVFSFGERFASPRVLSEALVLLGLSYWLDGRRLAAGCAVAGAALLHPLIALAGMGVMLWAVLRERVGRSRTLGLALLAAGLLGMQLLLWTGVSPRLDPEWRQVVERRSPAIYPFLWPLGDWLRLALDASLLWLAARHLQDEAGKLAGWLLPVLALSLLWALAAGAMDVQLAVSAQLQRVQWLAHLLALALAVPLCLGLWQSGGRDRYLAAGVAGSLVFPFSLGGLILPAAYGLYRWAAYRFPHESPGRGPSLILLAAFPGAGLALWLFYLAANLVLASAVNERPVWLWVFIQAPVALAVLLAGYALARRLRLDAGWLWMYGACALAIGALHWDLRKPWSTVYDHPERAAVIASAQALIPEDAVVYWESGVYLTPDNLARLDKGFERAWFWLRRSNYASFDQAAGNVFYRKTAMEAARRAAHLRQWGFRDGNLDWNEHKKPPVKFALSLARLRGVCTDPVLGFVITDTRLPAASLSFQDPLTGRKFSVYDCREVR